MAAAAAASAAQAHAKNSLHTTNASTTLQIAKPVKSISNNISKSELILINDYLVKYGYLNQSEAINSNDSNNNTSSRLVSFNALTNALKTYQTTFNISADGELNHETSALFSRYRCGVRDIYDANFNLAPIKWNTTSLTWRVFHSDLIRLIRVTEKAFKIWKRGSGLRFRQTLLNPNIAISFGSIMHNYATGLQGRCGNNFDGKGNTLAHAFFPASDMSTREIHIDFDEDWHTDEARGGSGDVYHNKISLLFVLVHEIGQTLGLRHSFDEKSIM